MPTFKHPCPHCGAFIERDVAACPSCGRADPFAPVRCASCRTALTDPTWVACPRCGAPTGGAGTTTGGPAGAPGGGTRMTASEAAPDPPASARGCSGCGAALAPGARFCRECGTVVA
jgi:RNA polymerase subunit RPABC4/transcription elongation factor Spt4